MSAALVLAGVACASVPKSGPAETFQAMLAAGNEVPPPVIDASAQPSGSATFTSNGTSITYKVTVSGLSSAYTAAHIHAGAEGVAGPVLVPLTLTGGPGTAAGEGSIDASMIKGTKADGSPMGMDDLLAAIRSGATYINVHTENNKTGEARGQIHP